MRKVQICDTDWTGKPGEQFEWENRLTTAPQRCRIDSDGAWPFVQAPPLWVPGMDHGVPGLLPCQIRSDLPPAPTVYKYDPECCKDNVSKSVTIP